MEVGDHPEIDETDLMDATEMNMYQMLVGSAQWAVTLGRYDIQYAVNTMARFAMAPRQGHVKRMLRLFGYLKHHKKFRIAFDTGEPYYGDLDFVEHDWSEHYPDSSEDIPDDMPEAKTRPVKITVYGDSSHGNCLVTRRSTTGIIVVVNRTPVFTYSKRQNTVESSTYGSEFVAGRIAIEKIIEYRYKCRMMGIAVDDPAVLLMDNEAVVKNSTLPSSTLKKKHNAIAYHKVREAVAAGFVKLAHVKSENNRSDILTKPMGPQDHYRLTCGILFAPHHQINQGELQRDSKKKTKRVTFTSDLSASESALLKNPRMEETHEQSEEMWDWNEEIQDYLKEKQESKQDSLFRMISFQDEKGNPRKKPSQGYYG